MSVRMIELEKASANFNEIRYGQAECSDCCLDLHSEAHVRISVTLTTILPEDVHVITQYLRTNNTKEKIHKSIISKPTIILYKDFSFH